MSRCQDLIDISLGTVSCKEIRPTVPIRWPFVLELSAEFPLSRGDAHAVATESDSNLSGSRSTPISHLRSLRPPRGRQRMKVVKGVRLYFNSGHLQLSVQHGGGGKGAVMSALPLALAPPTHSWSHLSWLSLGMTNLSSPCLPLRHAAGVLSSCGSARR